MNKSLKTIIWIVVIALVVWAVVSVVQNDSTELSTDEPIKVGATLALSGNLSFIGEHELNGLKMAIDKINSKGGINGKPLELIIEDNKGEAVEAVNNVSKFLNIDDVDVVISAFTHITNAVESIVDKSGKPMIYASTFKDIAEKSPLFFRDFFDAGQHGAALANAVSNSNHENIAFIAEISDVCNEFKESFLSQSSDNINIVAEEYFNAEEKDFKTYLFKIKDNNPDVIVNCTWRHEDIVMKQMKELNIMEIPTYHFVAPFLPSGDTDEMRTLYEENNSLTTWYWFSESEYNNKQQKFHEDYKNQFGVEPTGDAAYFYDDIFILSEALEKCDDINRLRDSNCISQELLKTDYDGIAGEITFSDKGVSDREVKFMKVNNGNWTGVPLQQ